MQIKMVEQTHICCKFVLVEMDGESYLAERCECAWDGPPKDGYGERSME